MVGLIMKDRSFQSVSNNTFQFGPEIQNTVSDPKSPTGPYSPAAESPGRHMTSEWLTASGKKLAPTTEKMLSLQQHDHAKVRRQLVAEISHILSVAPK